MTIHNHPTLQYRVRYPFPASEPAQVVSCDFCGTSAKATGEDAGIAAEKARKEGFVTVPGTLASDPKFWACRKCNPTNPVNLLPS